MAIVRSTLFTELRDKIADLEFRMRRNRKIELAKKRVPTNKRTEKQQQVRQAYGKCVEMYNKLSEEEKKAYAEKYKSEGLDSYRAFMRDCLKQMLPGMNYEIIIDNTQNSNDLTDYQVLLIVTNDQTFFNTFNNDHKYLEAYDSHNSDKLNFYVEEWDTTNYNARIWFKIPSIPANSTKAIYLKANLNRTESLSNPEQVFDFFDDFEGDSLDLNKWIVDSTAGTYSVTVGNSILELNANAGSVRITSIASFNYPVIVECLVADMNTYDAKNDTRHRYISSHANQNPFGSDCGVFDNPNYPTIQLFWQGTWPGTTANLNTFQLSQEIFIPNQLFRWKRPEWDKQGSTTLTSIKLQYGLGDYGQTDRYGHMKFDWIRVRKYIEPEPNATYRKL